MENKLRGRNSLTRKLFSTRDNSMYKWQSEKGIVGCLEVPSELELDFRGDLTPVSRFSPNGEEGREIAASFRRAREAWDELNLRASFVSACESMPASTVCCGLVRDDDGMVQGLAPHLNRVWSGHASERMEGAGYAVDCFAWSWNNLYGKSEKNILLIRFHDLERGGGGGERSRWSKSARSSSKSGGRECSSSDERGRRSPKSILKEQTRGISAVNSCSRKDPARGKRPGPIKNCSMLSIVTDATVESITGVTESPKLADGDAEKQGEVDDSNRIQ